MHVHFRSKTINGIGFSFGAYKCAVVVGALACMLRPVFAADRVEPTGPRPAVTAVRISESEAPVIDGSLNDAAWQKAAVIDKLTQIEPDHGEDVSERTVARIMYDSNNLYIGVYLYDSNPEGIIAAVKTRDGGIARDDMLRITIDPLATRRNGYSFQVNSLGARYDALFQNNTDTFSNWNTIWYAKSSRVSDGWITEVAVPFRSMSFDPSKTDWGFDLMRKIRRKNENAFWGPQPSGTLPNDISYTGTLQGMSGMNQGGGLDVQVYGAVRYKHQSRGQDDNDLSFRPSGNVFYKITPSLTGTLTLNTDFSDAPLDRRQVNTTRFSLFTEETRQFFLQDAAAFEFGGHSFGQGGKDNGRPFFSRNIGLVNGRPVPVIAGMKLSGDFSGISVGSLSVLTDGTDTTDGQLLSVMRLTTPIFEESKLGAIATVGDPTGHSDNAVLGVDFQYADSDFLGPNQKLQLDTSYQRSFSNVKGQDQVIAATLTAPNEPWGGEAGFKQVGENFTPSLGFANRKGIRESRGELDWRERYRDAALHWLQIGSEWSFITNLNNHLQSRENSVFTGVQTDNNDQYFARVLNTHENVDAAFNLPRSVLVPAGSYDWNHFILSMRSTQARPYFFAADIDCCSIYNGRYFRSNFTLDWNPNETWAFNLQHTMQLIHLPTGHVNIHIAELRVTTNFTPDMSIESQTQYDNISKRFSFLARYTWEYEPGSEIFASIGEQALITGPLFGPHYKSDNTQALIRIGKTIQY